MNLEYQTTFVVMPRHTNYMAPMIFGGDFFAELDLAAAACVNRLLHDSLCDSAVTHKFGGVFHDAAVTGDLIFINANIVELRHKSVRVQVEALREKRAQEGAQKVASAEFVFVTKKDGEFCKHGLCLPEENCKPSKYIKD